MKIIVCVKPVPSNSSVTIDPVTKTVRREAGESVISSLDKNALEAAVQLKRQVGGEIIVLSMAPASAEINIREALARGADRAIILSDRAFAGGDTFTTSYVLAHAIEQIGGADLILTGAASDDGGTSQLSVQLGEWLGYRHLHLAKSITIEDHTMRVTTVADGHTCVWKCEFPAVISVSREINKPGPASVRNIVMAARKKLLIWSADDLREIDRTRIGLKNSPTQNGELYPLETGRSSQIVEGDADVLAEKILEQFRSAGIQI